MARKIIVKPNLLQKQIQKIVKVRPITAFFSSRLHRMDKFALKITKGKFTLSQLAGWTIVQLTTIGAKTGQERTMPLIAAFDGENIVLIASSFGRKHNPGWYYNLKSQPECSVKMNGKTTVYIAHEVEGEEYEKYWQLGVSVFAGYEKYKERAAHRHIPVMVLEPKK
jgi:deazaflavin-dependent oxidoreductase (nitroreductase family)